MFVLDCSVTMAWCFEDENNIFLSTMEIARSYALTSYDALYLDLALKSSLPLASSDSSLRKAAKKAGVDLLFN